MSQDKRNTIRQPLGCIVVLERTYQFNHIEERILFWGDQGIPTTPFSFFEEYLGVSPIYAGKSDHEVLAYYPDQHPQDIAAHYGRNLTTDTTLFPYTYSDTPDQPQ